MGAEGGEVVLLALARETRSRGKGWVVSGSNAAFLCSSSHCIHYAVFLLCKIQVLYVCPLSVL